MSSWPTVRVGDVTTVRPAKREVKTRLQDEDDVSFMPMEDLGENAGSVSAQRVRKLGDVYANYTYFEDGDVLLAKITPCFENGKLGVATGLTNGVGFGSSEFMVLRPSSRLDAHFLYHLLTQRQFREAGARNMQGSVGHKRLPQDFVEDFNIPLPPLEEQKRIVATVDEAATLSSSLRDASTRQANAARSLVFAARAEVFRGLEVTHLLGDICEVLDRLRVPVTKRDRVSGEVPYYGATGIQDYVAEWIFNEPLVLLGEDGAKWGANEGSAFRISGPSWVNNHAHVLRPDRSLVLDDWLCEWLCHSDLADFISGVTVPKLNQERMRNIPVPVTSIHQQQERLDYLAMIREQSHRLAIQAEDTATEAEDLEASLLASLLTGGAA